MKGIKKIKQYRLIKRIGSGSVGEVYEAMDDKLDKRVAVKSISTKKITDAHAFDSFRRELKILHSLNHSNIIKISGIEKTSNNIYLILEYANGGNLFEYLSYYKERHNTPPPEKIVQFFVRQIVKGLEYMHERNIIHRDVKLENILIHFPQLGDQVNYDDVDVEECIIKIADLGYGKELAESGVAQTFCGTPMCMAPEMVNVYDCYNDNKQTLKYNSKVDLWSLGTITYELLFGIPPFQGKTIDELFKQIKSKKCNIPSKTSISIESISFLNGLLQFNADLRFDWKQITSHSFIVDKAHNFHIIDVEQVDPDKHLNLLEEDSKNLNNFLWVLIKPKNTEVELDKVGEKTLNLLGKIEDDNKEVNILDNVNDNNVPLEVNSPIKESEKLRESEEQFESAKEEIGSMIKKPKKEETTIKVEKNKIKEEEIKRSVLEKKEDKLPNEDENTIKLEFVGDETKKENITKFSSENKNVLIIQNNKSLISIIFLLNQITYLYII